MCPEPLPCARNGMDLPAPFHRDGKLLRTAICEGNLQAAPDSKKY
jgi:hypothetical protein